MTASPEFHNQASRGATATSNILIRDARIFDGTGDDLIDRGSVLVHGNAVVAVARSAEVPDYPHDTTVIDAAGRTLIPGLINAHAHITIDEMDVVTPRRHFVDGELVGILQAAARGGRCIERGITTLRNCNAPGLSTFALKRVFDRDELLGPRLFLSGQAITATGGHMHGISVEADGEDAVRRAARQQIKAGADFIKLVAEAASGSALGPSQLQLTSAELRAAVEVAHRLGKRVTCHAPTAGGVGEALDAGVDSIEHGYGVTDDQLDRMRIDGVWLVPTLSVPGSFVERGDEIDLSSVDRARYEGILQLSLHAVSRAHYKGVKIACGSDGGSPLNPVWDLTRELRLLVRAGLSAAEALTAATLRSAELLGVDQWLGSVEAGKVADLVLLNEDPLADISAVSQVAMVIKDGELCFNPLPR